MAGSSSDVMVFLTQNGVDVGAAARSIKLTTTNTEVRLMAEPWKCEQNQDNQFGQAV